MSETYTIAIIKPNKVTFTNNDDNLLSSKPKSETIEWIKTSINNFCNNYNNNKKETLMETIVDTIKLDTNLMGSTSLCKENSQKVYQLCHLNLEDSGMKNNDDDMNSIGNYLVMGDSIKTFGSCVFIASNILDTLVYVVVHQLILMK